jgi:hypothetical protein
VDPENQLLLSAELQARALNGTVWLFCVVSGVILWYRLPVDPFHKAILLGFVPYLLVFSVASKILSDYGWDVLRPTGYVHTVAYVLVTTFWAHAAWRPRRAPATRREGV